MTTDEVRFVLQVLRAATGLLPVPYHFSDVRVWPSREISTLLGYNRDHVATLLRGGRYPATLGEDYLLLEGAALAAFQADYRGRLEWQSVSAPRLTLVTVSGLLEAMCRAHTDAGRRARRIIVDEAKVAGAGGLAMRWLVAHGTVQSASASSPSARRPHLTLVEGGRAGT
jgi:hypothetical protein